MSHFRQALSVFRLPVWVGVPCLVLLLSACDDTSPLTNLNTNALSPAQALSYGRQSAIYQHLSHHWQLVSINNLPISYQAHLDLRQLSTGHATATLKDTCPPIQIVFDTSRIDQNHVSVIDIHRNLDTTSPNNTVSESGCADEAEDRLMAILADTKSIKRHPTTPDQLILTSHQDTLIFVLVSP